MSWVAWDFGKYSVYRHFWNPAYQLYERKPDADILFLLVLHVCERRDCGLLRRGGRCHQREAVLPVDDSDSAVWRVSHHSAEEDGRPHDRYEGFGEQTALRLPVVRPFRHKEHVRLLPVRWLLLVEETVFKRLRLTRYSCGRSDLRPGSGKHKERPAPDRFHNGGGGGGRDGDWECNYWRSGVADDDNSRHCVLQNLRTLYLYIIFYRIYLI